MVSKGGFTEGPSHEEGGIKMTVQSTGQKIEVEGGEGIINKHSMADNNRYVVEGTPRQIASAINEIDGNGVSFDKGASLKKLAKGGEIYDLDVSDRYLKNHNKYEIFANKEKIGEIRVGENYHYPEHVQIESIDLEDNFKHPKTYKYFSEVVMDRSNKKGALVNLECIDDSCFSETIKFGDVCDDCQNLIIK